MNDTTRLPKSKAGYGYKYTELSQINELLEQRGESYQQSTTRIDGVEYIITIKIFADGTKSEPIMGAQVIPVGALSGNKANPVQAYGAALTYARRYSLLMAYGLATEDDDAACLTQQPKPQQRQQRQEGSQGKATEIVSPTAEDVQNLAKEMSQNLDANIKKITAQQGQRISALLKEKNVFYTEVFKRYGINSANEMTYEQAEECIRDLESTPVQR